MKSHRLHIMEGRYAALFCLLLALAPVARVVAQPSPETLLRMICWRNEGEGMPGSVDLLAGFADANPGLRVNLTYDRWPQAFPRLKYWTGSLRDYAPDMTVVRDVWLPQFAGNLVPLDDKVTQADLRGITPAVLDRCRVNGKLLGIPWLTAARVLYCRADLLEAAKLQPPHTLDELRAAAKAMKTAEVAGLGLPGALGGGAVDAYLGLLWAHGAQPVVDNKLALKSDEATKALQYWVDLQREGLCEPEALSWTSAELDEAFAAGKVSMVFSGPALGKYLRRERPDLKFVTVPLPGAQAQPAQISEEVLVMLSSTKHPDDCVRFLRYMVKGEAQRAMWLMGGLPTHEKQVAEARQDPQQRAFVEHLEQAQGMPLQQTEKLTNVVERALWLALSGRADAKTALRTALREDEEGMP